MLSLEHLELCRSLVSNLDEACLRALPNLEVMMADIEHIKIVIDEGIKFNAEQNESLTWSTEDIPSRSQSDRTDSKSRF